MAEKQKRRENFSQAEKEEIIQFIRDNSRIMEDKSNSVKMQIAKKEKWKELAERLKATGSTRSWGELRVAYQRWKMIAKKNIITYNKYLKSPTGGPSAPIPSEIDFSIADICPENFFGFDENVYDESDSQRNKKQDTNPAPSYAEDTNPAPSYAEDTNPAPSYAEDTNPAPSYTEDTNPSPSYAEEEEYILDPESGILILVEKDNPVTENLSADSSTSTRTAEAKECAGSSCLTKSPDDPTSEDQMITPEPASKKEKKEMTSYEEALLQLEKDKYQKAMEYMHIEHEMKVSSILTKQKQKQELHELQVKEMLTRMKKYKTNDIF